MVEQKKKLSLEDIKVDSFVTAEENNLATINAVGGTGVSVIACTLIWGSCWHPCTFAGHDGPCGGTGTGGGPTGPAALEC